MFTPFAKQGAYSHQTCLTYFNLTQLLFLADRDIVYLLYSRYIPDMKISLYYWVVRCQ